MSKAILVGAGNAPKMPLPIQKEDYLVAVDGGAMYILEQNLLPDIYIGDFDSCKILLPHIPIEKHPTHKDNTDMELAIEHVIEKGYKEIWLFGADGGRMDHFLANLQLLVNYAQKGYCMRLIAPSFSVYALHNNTLTLPKSNFSKTISIFCFSEKAEGVYLSGLVYPLKNAILTNNYPLGVSNESIVGENTVIKVKKGTLLVFENNVPFI